jgi:hypothetical protein
MLQRLLHPGLALGLLATVFACRTPTPLPAPETVFATIGLQFET